MVQLSRIRSPIDKIARKKKNLVAGRMTSRVATSQFDFIAGLQTVNVVTTNFVTATEHVTSVAAAQRDVTKNVALRRRRRTRRRLFVAARQHSDD